MDFTEVHKKALALCGTVGIPSPFPASGSLYRASITDQSGTVTLFVKLVQIVHDMEFRTWLLSPDDIRAIRYQDEKQQWHLLIPGAGEIKKALEKAGEEPLFKVAIAYLPESTAVITRFEFAMTAAESIEDGLRCPPCNPPCCHRP